MSQIPTVTAFSGSRHIASGPLADVALAAKSVLDEDRTASVLIFDDATARPVEVDFRGSSEEVVQRIAKSATGDMDDGAPRGPGRPKLGVVAREVTLLPRHWEWLATQPGGASVALRKLVETARRAPLEQVRVAQDAANRFMTALAGNEPGYEEATRALFAGDAAKFAAETASWPADVRAYAAKLAAPALTQDR